MLVLAEILITLTNHLLEVTWFMMLLSSCTVFFMVFGIVALGIGYGALYPNFTCQNIAQVASGFGGVLFMIVSSLFIGMIIVLEAGPVYVLFISSVRGTPITIYQWILMTLSFLAAFLINIAAIFWPMKMGLRALREYE